MADRKVFRGLSSPIPVASKDVPQANSLERIYDLLRCLAAKTPDPFASNFPHVRDRAYYRRAAEILGVIDDDGELTVLGRCIAQSPPSLANEMFAEVFVHSEVGRSWLAWATETSLQGLRAEDASRFLRESCFMSPVTRYRRAKTLESWVRVFQANGRERFDAEAA